MHISKYIHVGKGRREGKWRSECGDRQSKVKRNEPGRKALFAVVVPISLQRKLKTR